MLAKYAAVMTAALVACVAAHPASSSSDSNGQCGANQITSCCESNSVSSTQVTTLLGLPFLAADCSPITGGVVPVPVGDLCGNQQAACCESDATSGLIDLNLECIPLGI